MENKEHGSDVADDATAGDAGQTSESGAGELSESGIGGYGETPGGGERDDGELSDREEGGPTSPAEEPEEDVSGGGPGTKPDSGFEPHE